MAEARHANRPTVQQIEKWVGVYISALRCFVEAADGELDLRVSLPGKGTFKLTGIGS